MAVAPATRRDVAAHGPSAGSGGGAEPRAPIRRRRAHSHRPGLCSDKWGASCPDVWSRGRRASPRQRGSCLGRRRSYGGPGPTKPVQPLSPPQRGASSLACTYPQRPRNPPLQGRRASDPAKAGIHREGRRPSPHMAVAPATPARKGGPHARRWTQTRPCWRSCSVPPPGVTPSSPICGRHPLGQPARQGTQTEVNQRRTIQQPRQGCPRQETIAVLPPGQLQKTTKKHKAILHRGINHTALLLTGAAKLSNGAPRNPPPHGRRASDRQRPRAP